MGDGRPTTIIAATAIIVRIKRTHSPRFSIIDRDKERTTDHDLGGGDDLKVFRLLKASGIRFVLWFAAKNWSFFAKPNAATKVAPVSGAACATKTTAKTLAVNHKTEPVNYETGPMRVSHGVKMPFDPIPDIDIKGWFARGKEKGATHMIVLWDWFSNEYHAEYVMPGEDAKKPAPEGYRVMEVYNLSLDMMQQNAEPRSFNY